MQDFVRLKETYDSARPPDAESNAQVNQGPRQKGTTDICPHHTSWFQIFTKSLHSNYAVKKISLRVAPSYFVGDPNGVTKRIKEGMWNPRNKHRVVCEDHIPAGNWKEADASEPTVDTSKDIDVYFKWTCEC